MRPWKPTRTRRGGWVGEGRAAGGCSGRGGLLAGPFLAAVAAALTDGGGRPLEGKPPPRLELPVPPRGNADSAGAGRPPGPHDRVGCALRSCASALTSRRLGWEGVTRPGTSGGCLVPWVQHQKVLVGPSLSLRFVPHPALPTSGISGC